MHDSKVVKAWFISSQFGVLVHLLKHIKKRCHMVSLEKNICSIVLLTYVWHILHKISSNFLIEIYPLLLLLYCVYSLPCEFQTRGDKSLK